MALTIAPWRQNGYKLTDEDISDDAEIEISKLGTRTIRDFLAALEATLVGSGVIGAARGDFAGAVLPNANSGSLYWNWNVPDEWVSGNDITFRIFWGSGSTGGDVKFTMTLRSTAADGDTASEVSGTVTTTAPTAGKLKASTITIAAANFAAGDIVGIKLTRDPADAADTLAADIECYGVDAEFTGRG